jgi:diadenosine tetraphosphate (Ap4A) HIT family hydrolase
MSRSTLPQIWHKCLFGTKISGNQQQSMAEAPLALTEEEQAAIWSLIAPVRQNIEKDHSPDGYNIGVKIGAAGGQTVPHAHLHVVPRYSGDVQDPRGGI